MTKKKYVCVDSTKGTSIPKETVVIATPEMDGFTVIKVLETSNPSRIEWAVGKYFPMKGDLWTWEELKD